MTTPLQVLVVEDNDGDAQLLRGMFRSEPPGSVHITHKTRLGEALTHLQGGGVDVVLLDMGLPDGHGLETVRRTCAAAPAVPVIVLTGLDDESLAAAAMKEGAQDYFIKGQIENRALPRALRYAVERHRLQAQTDRIKTEQAQFKDEFFSHVSHELRSPLNAIYQFVSILRDGLAGELSAVQLDYLGIVQRNVFQLRAMIDDLLEGTRVQAGMIVIEPERTSIADCITDAVDTLTGAAVAKTIMLRVHLQSSLPALYADPTRVRQILIILLDNAIKFTPPGGIVDISCQVSDGDGGKLLLEVRDSGSGIAAESCERIFERLFQAAGPSVAGRKGLGLGLHICRELVSRQGGSIWATSVLGQGGHFSVLLPIFSLHALLAQDPDDGSDENAGLSLVVLEVASPTGWLSADSRAEDVVELRQMIKDCLQGKQEILLPRMGSSGTVELIFIVIETNGSASLADRVETQRLARNRRHRESLTVATSQRLVPQCGSSVQLIQHLIDEELALRIAAP